MIIKLNDGETFSTITSDIKVTYLNAIHNKRTVLLENIENDTFFTHWHHLETTKYEVTIQGGVEIFFTGRSVLYCKKT